MCCKKQTAKIFMCNSMSLNGILGVESLDEKKKRIRLSKTVVNGYFGLRVPLHS